MYSSVANIHFHQNPRPAPEVFFSPFQSLLYSHVGCSTARLEVSKDHTLVDFHVPRKGEEKKRRRRQAQAMTIIASCKKGWLSICRSQLELVFVELHV